jgi:hypothetical protein
LLPGLPSAYALARFGQCRERPARLRAKPPHHFVAGVKIKKRRQV